MSKKKKGRSEWVPLIPVGVVILMLVALVVWQNVDLGPDSEPETLDTGQDTTSSVNDVPVVPAPDAESEEYRLRQPPEDVEISCDEIAIYNGEFVESGKDEPVTDVASMLVTNKSEKYLEYAKLTYEVDGHEAVFVVTGLHPGKSAWVLESNGLKATADSKFVYKDALTAYKDHVVRAPKELNIKYGNKMLKITNLTDEPLENVVVHYKVVHKDGNYFGGITYKVSFGTVEPGQSIEKIAGHYDEDWTQIVRVGWMETSVDNSA